MRLVRLAIANVNTTVGAVGANVERAISLVRAAAADGATMIALPEQAIGGYPPEDLVQWRSFVEAQWRALRRLAMETSSLSSIVVVGVVVARGASVYNCAALLHSGHICGLVPKEKLPTYDVFYEGRTLSRGLPGLFDELDGTPFGDLLFEFDFGTVAIEVCEDLWSPDGPMRRRCYAGAELVVNVSASPYRVGVTETRREMITTRAGDNCAVVLYANLVGANDGLVFDGGGLIAQNGRLIHEADRFVEGTSAITVDLDRTRRLRGENTTWRLDQESYLSSALPNACPRRLKVPTPTSGRDRLRYPVPPHRSFFLPAPEEPRSKRTQFCEDLLDALALGVGDYFEKTGAFRTIGVALSGGRDSLLCLLIARRYINSRFRGCSPVERDHRARQLLRAFFLPSRYSSAETRRAAEQAATDLAVPLKIISIEEIFESELREIEKMLQPGEALGPVARQNLQARIRAERMWTWANTASGLFLQTSNMSEKAVGYSTIGGDSEGALAVIANVPKTVVNYLLDYLYETTRYESIRLTLERPASAELAENQEDERDLMPFRILDACFALYAGERMGPDEVKTALTSLFPEEEPRALAAHCDRFARLFSASIYKWVQAPLSLHVGNLDLERERALQLPVVSRSEWQER
jgi:NAD+ synthase (glutamine-hydrolysing)